MKLNEDIDLVDGEPIAYIRSLESLVMADLHLGYEGVMADNGIFIPKVNLKHIEDLISKAVEIYNPKRVIIDGDIKNDFSKVTLDEFNELLGLINFLKSKKLSIILIKGNHDNFVDKYREAFKLEIYQQEMMIDNYLFIHGEMLPDEEHLKKADFIIMGHEHPSIAIYNDVGGKEKLRCFLLGKYKSKDILVLPAMSYFAGGTEVNILPKKELLSPLFRNIKINSMEVYSIGYDSTMDFGKLGLIKDATY